MEGLTIVRKDDRRPPGFFPNDRYVVCVFSTKISFIVDECILGSGCFSVNILSQRINVEGIRTMFLEKGLTGYLVLSRKGETTHYLRITSGLSEEVRARFVANMVALEAQQQQVSDQIKSSK
jgi:hypothetical protein